MPEYLSPGVYIEELPPQLRAIEGVSTSTAGFAGVAQRGPVPGFPLPFTPLATDPQVVPLVPDPTPVLVTSFADFMRKFGSPLPLPDPTDVAYLGYAVQGFFANGGLRAYIARVVHLDSNNPGSGASYGGIGLNQGVVLPLAASVAITAANPSTDTLAFAALRGVAVNQSLSFFHKDGTPVTTAPNTALTATVKSYNAATGTVEFNSSIAIDLNAGDIYAAPTGAAATQGPFFWARNPGSWSALVSVAVTPTRRRAVAIAAALTPTEIQVASTAGFYVGAIVEIDNAQQQTYAVVSSIGAGSLQLTRPLAVSLGASSTVRIAEIDITVTDSSPAVPVTETYRGLTWNPDANPSLRARHYSTVINAQSSLVYVQPPGVGAVDGTPFGGSETAAIASQPATFNGQAISISGANSAIAAGESALNAVRAAIQDLEDDLASLASATLPLGANAPLLAKVKADQDTLGAAKAAAESMAIPSYGPAAGLGDAVSKVKTESDAAAATVTGALAVATTSPAPPNAAATLNDDHDSVQQNVAKITAAITALAPANVVTGSDAYSDIIDDDYVGVDNGPGHRSGILSLQDAEDVSIIAAPGRTTPPVQDALIDQCQLLRYRFAVLDGEQDPAGGSVNAILAHRDQYDSSYAAYYAPWVAITLNGQDLFLPPSGHMAGVYAGTDNDRGVWKAPANVVFQNITGLKYYFTKGEQDVLNPEGVNLIRRFTATGTRVWGARTISSDPSLKYVNVRRTLIFLEASIDRGTQWVVFEPNTLDTWGRLTDSVTAFLTTQWASGALFGAKPEDAFFVRCDQTTMTADDIQNGRLICLIGVAIVRPAEFVIFRIEQTTGYANQ